MRATNLLIRLGVPVAWTVITALVIAFQSEWIIWSYQKAPVISVELIILWFILGTAFIPFSRERYTWGSVALITAGTIYGLIVSGFDFSDKTRVVIAAAVWFGVCIAWLGGLGTLYWRFAQGKLAVDDDDT